MKNVICLLLLGILTFSSFTPNLVEASTNLNNAAQIEMLQKLIIKLQAQLTLLSTSASTNQTPSLTYKRQTDNVDKNISKFGVTFTYQGPASCTSLMPDYKISFGDGKTAKADCKGVIDHVYKKDGTYTAKYTNKGKSVAMVKVVIDTSVANPIAVLSTTKGVVEFELFADTMPITTGNFQKLIKQGYYNGIKFHRVIDGFMIQGGDPLSKDDSKINIWGTGGPGYAIADEHIVGKLLTNTRGTIAMANSGPKSGGSQFFINLADNTNLDFDKPPLSSAHPVFGRVITGMDVVDAIGKVMTARNDRPLEPVIITKATIK
jgi:peptidylprolyl isomerase